MSKREITARISLTGIKPFGYSVKTSGFDGCLDIDVPTVKVGNAIVRALREEAAQRPDLFPPSKQPGGAKP